MIRLVVAFALLASLAAAGPARYFGGSERA